MGMKVRKTELKKLIKQCLVEIIREDPNVGRMLVKEAIVDMFGAQMLMGESPAPGRNGRRRPPRRTNVPAMMNGGGGGGGRVGRASAASDMEEPTDLFEHIMADTLLNTYGDQLSEDKSDPSQRTWADMAADQGAMDDGPATHLQNARFMPDPNAGNRAAMMAQSSMNAQQMMAQAQMGGPGQMTPQQMQQMQAMQQQAAQQEQTQAQVGEPSQGQLERMFMQQQQQQQQPQQRQQQVPGDLAALGLGNKQWDAHFDAGPSPLPQNPGQDPNLAAIAAEMNNEFAR